MSMSKSKYKIIVAVVILAGVGLLLGPCRKSGRKGGAKTTIVNPEMGEVLLTVTTTGIVEPQNRLEVKPSIGGRLENILVREGDSVKEGDTLAWMSSTERAALVDAARSEGEESLTYWENAYKKTPIVSPINGKVIVRAAEQGQTVTSSDAVIVLSDRLVVSAQFDETDIGRIKVGQKTLMALDAYPEVRIEGIVDHIAYESEIVNNVTIYNVDILPNEVPETMRSGMSVTADVVEKSVENVLTIPAGAIHYDGKRQFVLVQLRFGKPAERDIEVGLNNEKTAEIISGLNVEDNVIMQESIYLPKRSSRGANPFMPSRNRKK